MSDYQVSLFDGKDVFKLGKPIRLIELFAGYGSQAKALEDLGVPFESWRICEWAVPSIQAYKDLHKENDNTDYSKSMSVEEVEQLLYKLGISSDYNKPMTIEQIRRRGEMKNRATYNNIVATNNLVNITQVTAKDLSITDREKFDYILTYSFPCQDISTAGKRLGANRGGQTRSGLLWEVERILLECKTLNCLPQVLLMENVRALLFKEHIQVFGEWVTVLEKLGYKCYWEVLNAKDFGIPQNRERVFMISILGDYMYHFPKPIKLEKRLIDFCESNVDESYYLSEKMVKYFTEHTKECKAKGNGFKFEPTIGYGVGKTITTRAGGRMDDNFIKEIRLEVGGV